MGKHTAGSWTVHDRSTAYDIEHVGPDGLSRIAECWDRDVASLLAAAPLLLAVAEELLAPGGDVQRAIGLARTALAAARGES